MQLQTYVEALERELTELGSLGDPATAQAAERLVRALATPVRVQLLELAGEAAAEVSAQLSSGHVEVRLAGSDPSLVYVTEDADAPPAAAATDDAAARITFRLPEGLKANVEVAAGRDGISVNAWLVRAVSRQLNTPQRGPHQIGKRLTGFARS